MSDDEKRFSIHLQRVEDYRFEVDFDLEQIPRLLVDEPPPLGDAAGPNPSRMVALAAAHCLCASLNFCLEKVRTPPGDLSAEVIGKIRRNEKGRLRLAGIEVRIEVAGVDTENKRLNRCLKMFEDFCVVSSALRDGIDVDVSVHDDQGNPLRQD